MTNSNIDKIAAAKARARNMLERSKAGTYKSVNFSNKPARQLMANEPTVYNKTTSF
ncbi:hypothetical protein ACPV30_11855 [Photobacterium damselae]|uniref:hypothetical protein n=1 Tax=Photobacterium damselae TaxID=38293 RepID=UPI001F1FC9ED|nr:hypothetical protein [Photobacterium damselae]UKA01667.1 hypothetical protein IHC89_13675 [Photobacterium damselae subsp. damselae]